jgi:hypothetical protein
MCRSRLVLDQIALKTFSVYVNTRNNNDAVLDSDPPKRELPSKNHSQKEKEMKLHRRNRKHLIDRTDVEKNPSTRPAKNKFWRKHVT